MNNGSRSGGGGCGSRHDERNSDGKLAGEEQRGVDETGSGGGGVTTGVGSESVIELVGVGLTADVGGDELAVHAAKVESSNDILLVVLDIWVATGEQIRSGLAKNVLHSLCEPPGRDKSEGETQ